jgi:hydroxyacylglutathione hydrolase
MIQIDALPAFSDNYIWLLQDTAKRRCAVVDPGDAAPVQAGWPPTRLGAERHPVTHHHTTMSAASNAEATTGARSAARPTKTFPAATWPWTKRPVTCWA